MLKHTEKAKQPANGRRRVKADPGKKLLASASGTNGNGTSAGYEAQAERERRYCELKSALAEARDALKSAPPASRDYGNNFVANKQGAYQELVSRIRQAVADSLPLSATVLVVNRGDSELLKLGARKTWHFPQTEDGVYAGHHPPDSATAIEHLEQLRAKGAEYLIFPSTALWWLDFYVNFRRHLEQHYAVVLRNEGVCLAFAVRERKPATEVSSAQIEVTESEQSPAMLPGESDLRVELYEALSAQGRIDEAHACLLEGLRHEPTNARLLLAMVRCEQGRGNQSAADRYATESLTYAPDDFAVNFTLAQLACQRGRTEVAEERFMRLAEFCPSDASSLIELARLYCARLETCAGPPNQAVLGRLLALFSRRANMQRLPAELVFRIAESLSALNKVDAALEIVKTAIGRLDFTNPYLRDFVVRLLQPAVSDQSFIPFDNRRSLAAFLTHMGNGFRSIQNRFKASACYQAAHAASPETFAPDFNLAFAAVERGNVLTALEHFSRATRIYSDDAEQICWPASNGHAWPHAAFDVSAAFEALKSPDVAWPKITVITPSYNQAQYVEETILSVLHQNYPALEYIVVDGGSTDGAADILRCHEARFTKLIIEPDEGQTDAINKGLRLATGELILWVNSDDMLAPGALFMVALTYLTEQADVIAGFCLEHTARRFSLINLPAVTQATFNAASLGDIFNYWLKGHYFYQPEVAFSRRILEQAGGSLDKSLHYTMDYEFWMRCAAAGGRVSVVHWPVGLFRRHDAQKTANLDHTIIEQATVRDRHVVPQPGFERKLEIGRRFARALARPMPEISVISTRASKIFSADTARELRTAFAQDRMRVTFHESVNEQSVTQADLVILLVHLFNEHAPLRSIREDGCDVPIAGWFWDNHHHIFDNHKAVDDLDLCIPGHAFAGSYLRSGRCLTAASVPLCVTQWTSTEAARFFERHGECDRSDSLYGGFVRYAMAAKRNLLVERLIAAGMDGVYFLEEDALERYFGMSLERRFQDWASHKVSLCLPLSGDLSQRLFDALLTGQIPIVPNDIYDLDAVIPRTIQDQLPVIRFDRYSADDVTNAHAAARRLFDEGGQAGIRRRHMFALENHMFLARIRTIVANAHLIGHPRA